MCKFKHKPVFIEPRVTLQSNALKDDFESKTRDATRKWLPVLNQIIKEIDLDKFNYDDKVLLTFYIEWLSISSPENLTDNIIDFKKMMLGYINSDSMNHKIIEEVYNPLLNKIRYRVLKNEKEVIIDELTHESGFFFLIDLYPDSFLNAVGLKGYVRNKKLEDILDTND